MNYRYKGGTVHAPASSEAVEFCYKKGGRVHPPTHITDSVRLACGKWFGFPTTSPVTCKTCLRILAKRGEK